MKYYEVVVKNNPENVISLRVKAISREDAVAKVGAQYSKRLADVELGAWELGVEPPPNKSLNRNC